MKRTLSCLVLLLAVSISPAGAVTVTDGDFASWASFSFVTDDPTSAVAGPNTSTGSAARVTTGGNPGALLRATHTVTSGDTIWTGAIKTDYTYDLSVEGALASLAVDVDLRHPVSGATAWQLVVVQGGQRYYSVPFGAFGTSAAWASFSASDLNAADFDTNPWAGSSGVLPDGSSPDFGTGGSPLQFGFMFGNRVIGGGVGTVSNTVELDNFSVTTTPVAAAPIPEPATGLLILAGIGLVGWRARLGSCSRRD